MQILTAGGSQVLLQRSDGITDLLAVSTKHDGTSWHASFSPALHVVNYIDKVVHVHCMATTPSNTGQMQSVSLSGLGSTASINMLFGSQINSSARVWLGKQGWSLPIALSDLQPRMQVLHPDPLPSASQPAPPLEAPVYSLGLLTIAAMLSGPHISTGKFQLTIFHPIQLFNRLPFPLEAVVPHGDGTQQQLDPGSSLALPVPQAAGEVVKLAGLGSSYSSVSPGKRLDVSVVAPAFNGTFDFAAFQLDLKLPAVSLPEPGSAIELPTMHKELQPGNTAPLRCLLRTEQGGEGLPIFALSVVPQLTLRNSMPVQISIEVTGTTSQAIEPHSVRPISCSADLSAARLGIETSIGGSTVQLHSGIFDLSKKREALIHLKGTMAREVNGTHQVVECRMWVCTQMDVEELGSTALVRMTVSPGHYISNMTGLPLVVRSEGENIHLDGTTEAAAVDSGTSAPLLQLWTSTKATHPTTRAVHHRRGSSWGATDLLQSLLPQAAPVDDATAGDFEAVGLQLAIPDEKSEVAWSDTIRLYYQVGRQRLYLQQGNNQTALLTYRTLLDRGRLHIVLFRLVCLSISLRIKYLSPSTSFQSYIIFVISALYGLL